MALRTLSTFISLFLLVLLFSSPAQACFGPKLFVGVGQETHQEALFALVTLYVQEKTGVESTRVEIVANQNPADLLDAEKVDLVFVTSSESSREVVFQITGLPFLITGPRPLDDLQFTTVLPAIKKLNRLLSNADFEEIVAQIEAGESAMSVARKFLMENRWI